MGDDFGGQGYPYDRRDIHAVGNYVVAVNNGLRCWRMEPVGWRDVDFPHNDPTDDATLRLTSLSQHYTWVDGVNRSDCLLTPSQAASRLNRGIEFCRYPTVHCLCGFYAYYDRDYWVRRESWSAQRWPIVTGVIEGWGRCVVGNKGFRAENALIVGLALPEPYLLPDRWVGERDRHECHELLRSVINENYPNVPVYDSVDELLTHSPLEGRPDR